MNVESSFTVPAPIDQVWSYMNDPKRMVNCAPGASLTQIVSDKEYKGEMQIKMGPVKLAFGGTINVVERNDASHRVVMKAKGSEKSGKGQAEATVTAVMTSSGNGTNVSVNQDIQIAGALAQYGRGMIQDVTNVMMKQVASCIAADIKGGGRGGGAAPKPVSGLSLGFMAMKMAIMRFFKNLFGGGKKA